MKRISYYIFACVCLAVLLPGCRHDEEWTGGGNNEPPTTPGGDDLPRLTIVASDGGFTSGDGTLTRAVENGYSTQFVDGDRMGVFAVSTADGSILKDCKNYSRAYKSGAWETVPLYSGADYFAYYPYDPDLGDVKSLDDIVAFFNNKVAAAADQSTYAKYAALDLMTTEVVIAEDSKLKFDFQHQMSMVEIAVPHDVMYKYAENKYRYLDKLVFKIGSQHAAQPYEKEKGVYRYLVVPAQDKTINVSGDIVMGDKSVVYSKAVVPAMGSYKRLNITGGHNLTVGDYYYSDEVITICPENAATPPAEKCLGVVFWVGDITEEDPLLKQEFPDGTHGLVVALNDAVAEDIRWQNTRNYGECVSVSDSWLGKQGDTYGITTLVTDNNMQGYANTKALKAYNQSEGVKDAKLKILPVEAINIYSQSHTAPESSSGWYFPSVKELKYMCWGQDATEQGTGGRVLLDRQFNNVGGTPFQTYYLSSSESGSDPRSRAWCVNFYDGFVYGDYKYSNLSRLRSCLAF